MKKRIILLVLATLALPVLLMSLSKGGAGDSVELAVSGPYSGDLASYGIPARRAVELVFKDSPNVKINYLDDQCDPSVAANVAANIISSQAVFVVGHICSGATQAALEVYKQTGIGVISPSATNPALTKSGDYQSLFFRTIAPDDDQGDTQAAFLVDKLGVKSVAIVHDKADYGKGLAEYSRKGLENRGITIALFDGITPGEADYSTVVNKIASANVDAVVFGGYHPEASKLVIQLKRRGVTAPFISGDGIKDDSFLQLAGDAAENVYATGPKDNSGNKLYQVAKDAHLKAYSEEPGAFFYEGYSAALALKQAIESLAKSGGKVSPQAVRDYLQDSSNSFDTPIGKISFNQKGDAIGAGFAVYQVRNGVYTEAK